TRQALQFISRNRERPWFCFLSHHMIHGNVVAPAELEAKYRRRGFTDEGPNRAVYLAGLETIDRSVGTLMTELKEMNESDETVVIFLSDNGGIDQRLEHRSLQKPHPLNPKLSPNLVEYSNAPLRNGKGSIYEGGVRVPLIIRWPGVVKPGTVVDTPVHAVDLAPTLFEIVGHKPGDKYPLDGIDLRQVLGGKENLGDDETNDLNQRPIYQYCPFYDLNWGLTPCASIRVGPHKLIEFFGDRFDADHQYIVGNNVELYDLDQDLGETRNIAEVDRDTARRLRAQLHQWMSEMDVQASRPNPYHVPDRAFETTSEKPPWFRE
ncbi:MAG: sulfatase-like hydrolase/transferase, partial [Planctomycetota bacterium]